MANIAPGRVIPKKQNIYKLKLMRLNKGDKKNMRQETLITF